ncbi:MAG: GxxExxY protein [Bacteroidota bacterium]
MTEKEISYIIRGAIFKVYNSLGPGLLESVYEAVLLFELRRLGVEAKSQVGLPVIYENEKLDLGFRIDIIVNNLVIIEIKSVEQLAEVHHKQVLTYLKLANKKLGILVNFNTDNISNSIFRKVNKLHLTVDNSDYLSA